MKLWKVQQQRSRFIYLEASGTSGLSLFDHADEIHLAREKLVAALRRYDVLDNVFDDHHADPLAKTEASTEQQDLLSRAGVKNRTELVEKIASTRV